MALIAVAGLLSSCDDKFGFDEIHQTPQGIYKADRLPSEESRRALILYSAGYNSLSTYLASDINDLQEGYIPKKGRNENLLFIVSRQPVSSGNYSVPTPTVIIQLYKDKGGNPIMDTLLTMNTSMVASTASTMKSALTYIRDNFHVKSYGMIFSSHASGWLPKGLYSDATTSTMSLMQRAMEDPSLPAVKSIGQD
ncbi:MAG: clostripain-related cysteine peptidase, partial [Bacteroidales bacterium]|nr:clostripain-related cysteine peptidase [Bacteroidales bacterium]